MNEEMNLQDMLSELLRFYPITNRKDEDIAKDMITYHECILENVYKSNQKYDWEKCLKYILTHRIYKTFPSIPEILEALPYSLKKEKAKSESCADEGFLLVVTLPNGYTYHFTVSSTGKPMSEVKSGLEKKFGQCSYKIYPKGTLIIGEQRWEPD
jgi:hypothetical protein